MGQKIKLHGHGTDSYYGFSCPGCKDYHRVRAEGPHAWGWNGSVESPTFTPSILVQGTEDPTEDEWTRIMAGEKIPPRPTVCHSFVRDGQIQFLGDCTHPLANQTVPLSDIKSDI